MTSATRGIGKSVHSSDQAAFCELMIGARKAAGLTQHALARRLKSFVAKYEGSERRVDVVEFIAIARALGADPRVRVPRAPLSGVAVSAPVDVFVRPEHLRIVDPSDPCATTGTIVTHVYQGGHVDTYLACPDTPRCRVLVRWSGPDALSRWPIGATVGLTITSDDATAFAIG
jgi:hypothetical protein